MPRFFSPKPAMENRIHLLDEIRGFAVFCMLFYHGFFTFSQIFPLPFLDALLSFFAPLEPLFAGLFLFLSGICANLSRSNLRRGARLAVVAALVTAVTVLLVPAQPIWFGILHLLSAAMLLAGCLLPLLRRLPVLPSMAVFALLTAFTYAVPQGYLGFFSIPIVPLPSFLYRWDWLCWLGLHTPDFYSADYFPLLPWLFVFLCGVCFGQYVKAGRFPAWAYRRHCSFFAFLGRHAFWFYIIHQPILYGIGWIFCGK